MRTRRQDSTATASQGSRILPLIVHASGLGARLAPKRDLMCSPGEAGPGPRVDKRRMCEGAMKRPSWAPPEIDLDRPSAARVYDFYLGGFHNFPADRAMAQEAIRMWPELPVMMQANRAFLRRAIRFAVAHSRAILGDDPATVVLQADLREPEAIVADERVRGLLDLDRPVAVLVVALLHFVPDSDDPGGVIGRLSAALAPGSLLVISHASSDGQPELAARHQKLYARTPTPMTMRSRDEIADLFHGFQLLEPGVVPIQQWHPEPESEGTPGIERMVGFAGVGVREPAR